MKHKDNQPKNKSRSSNQNNYPILEDPDIMQQKRILRNTISRMLKKSRPLHME